MKTVLHTIYGYMLSLCVSVASFFGLWRVFFQQDEWSGFGRVIAANEFGFSSLFRTSGWHVTPLTTLFMASLYTFFGLHLEICLVLYVFDCPR